jgi:hypothetical protein
MSAVDVVDHDEWQPDPDTLKVPESPLHRQTVELIATVARRHLGDGVTLFCDLNWYPLDEGHAVAPDVMLLPSGVLPEGAKSYKQPKDGPSPSIVIEVPSDTDSYTTFLKKVRRYAKLGAIVYVVDALAPDVVRWEPSSIVAHGWLGRPIPELGDIVLDAVDDALVARAPDGVEARTAADFLALVDAHAALARLEAQQAQAVAEQALAEAQQAQAEAQQAQARVAALEGQLRALGAEPAD